MKQIYSIGLLVVLILQSCGTNDVVSKRIIQKRKYTKGFHIAKRGNLNSKQEKVRSDEKVYSYDHHAKAQLIGTQVQQEQRYLLEEKMLKIDHLKADMVKSKTKERSDDKISRIGSSTIKCEEHNHRDEQKDRFENEKTLDISKFAERVERTDEAEPVAPDLVERRSKRIRGLAIASIVLSSAGLTAFLLVLLFNLMGFYGTIVLAMLLSSPVFYGIGALLALSVLILFFCQPKDQRSRQDKIWMYSSVFASVFAISVTWLSLIVIFWGF